MLAFLPEETKQEKTQSSIALERLGENKSSTGSKPGRRQKAY
jgi:hypothetical protein